MKKKIKLLSTESIKDNYLIFSENNSTFEVEDVECADENVQEADGSTKKVLSVTIRAIHSGRTENEHIFAENKLKGSEELQSGVFSFTKPYCKPMLTHHNTHGEAVGRIVSGEWMDEDGGHIQIKVLVTDPDAIEKVKDGRYNTVSIGARTNQAKCNICGTDRLQEWCSHRRGEVYEGVKCGWELGDLWFYECSFVNAPADQKAVTVSWQEIDYDPYNDGVGEESGEEGMTEEEKNATGKVAASNENLEGTEDPTDPKEGTEPTENTSQENTEDTEDITENSDPTNVNEENEDASSVEETTVVSTNISEEIQKAFASMKEEMVSLVKDTVSEMVSVAIESSVLKTDSINEKLESKEKELQSSYSTIMTATENNEKAFTALKEFYNKLKKYSDNETEEFSETWSLEKQVDEINKLFDQIDAEIASSTDYSMSEGNKGKVVKEDNLKSKPKTIEENVYGLMTRKRF